MRILQINNDHYPRGGAEAVYLNTIQLLRGVGHQVFEFSQSSDKNLNSEYKDYFSAQTDLLFSKFYNINAGRAIRKVIDTFNPEIAHFHNIIGGLSFSILRELKKKNIPIVVTIHDYRFLCPVYNFLDNENQICELCVGGKYYNCFRKSCSPRGKSRSLFLSLESYFRDYFLPFDKLIDYYIFVGRFSKSKFAHTIKNINTKSSTIYNCALQKVTESKPENYFLYFGRLSKEKGILTLLQAFKELNDQKLIIAGDGELKEIVANFGSPNIEYVGFKAKNELMDLISRARFTVTPSECYENNPMSIVESFSLGTPVIGSNLGSIPELINNGKTGILFNSGDVEDLRNAIRSTSSLNSESYKRMTEATVFFAKENFSCEQYTIKLEKIYQTLLKAKRN